MRACWVVAGMVALACTGKGPGTGAGSQTVTTAEIPDGGSSTGAPDGGSPAATPDAGTASPGGTPDAGVALSPPIRTSDGWTFYARGQGLSDEPMDVSADEAGNVYVAGTDAVYAKTRSDDGFQRFDSTNAGLTQNCYQGVLSQSDPSFGDAVNGKLHPTPPGPAVLCPVISVAGAAAGTAAIGFKGIGTDGDPDADWAQDSGGMDVVTFDGKTLSRKRHVFIASPPKTICGPYPGHPNEERTSSCGYEWEYFWQVGRRKLRQVNRIVVNHDGGSRMYGDMWMGGTHATVAALLDNAAARGYPDHTAGQSDPKWADAKDVWEHDHPAWYDASLNLFLTNVTYALAIDPRSGIPWASNGLRTAYVTGYGGDLHSDVWWVDPQDAAHPLWIDVWTDPGTPGAPTDPLGAAADNVMSLSFCNDGTLWFGSATHGLARRDPGGGMSGVSVPDPGTHGNSVYAVACDPSDGSVWVGLGWGGLMRYKNGSFTLLDPTRSGLPSFVRQPVMSIQIDRWASPRVVYVAFVATKDQTGKVVQPGGVAAYSGP